MNILHELTTGIAGAPAHKVGKACFSSVLTYHAASSPSSRASSVSPSRRSSALSATTTNSATGAPEDGARPWEASWQLQLQTDAFRGYGSGGGGMFGSGGQGGSGRPGHGGGNPFPGDSGSRAGPQFLFVGLKPDHASSFMGAVWHLLSVVCMMQTVGFLLYGDIGGGDVFRQDECFDTVEI